ncbi:probable E3 ubiquitin-protein ligase HECTD2 isoform X2 [Daktulosphaira vitifoliae]|uniref:probable E3 ubiquitin-protein ligase HECTD2 isoform X2 n=1 Tax=Daktulosphaira vitifoliae TaxID=58002 RepID=UPI0021A9FCD4|nr:probable E3 ubiquitin-protein ligase HECTD2 isoform X2 [Daktulosphaira vitifoliae]
MKNYQQQYALMTSLWNKARRSFLNSNITFAVVPCVNKSSIRDNFHRKNTDVCESTGNFWNHVNPCPFCGHEDSPIPVRSQRSSSDPTVSSLSRLPPIENSNQFVAHRSDIATITNNNLVINESRNLKKKLQVEIKPQYPTRHETREDLLQEVRKSHKNENFIAIQRFYERSFNSFAEICALFKINPNQSGAKLEDPELHLEFIYSVHDSLKDMPNMIHKTVLKSVINALLEKKRSLYEKDEVRALYVLLQCPIFETRSSAPIFAHLLNHIAHINKDDHQLLIHWFRILELEKLKTLIRYIMQFITLRQFSLGDKSLPPIGKTRWWIPSATKTLALINAANRLRPVLFHFTELYNSALDHIDLMNDYYTWQTYGPNECFAYCQYPFILSIIAKRVILTKDSEQQMILNARKSLVSKVSRRQTPNIDIFFLNINVRRSHLVQDSLNEIAFKQKDLKKKLKVSFAGEPGLDMGGLTKEWFLLLIREIFDTDYGMFVFYPHSQCYWFSTNQTDQTNLREYNLIGVLMGLAVYNSTILDLCFPGICYRKLLSPPVIPSNDNNVGIVQDLSLDDLEEIMPDIAQSLQELLKYEGNVEDDMGLTFQVSLEEKNKNTVTYSLIRDGENIPVTNDNREEYVTLYLNWFLNHAIYEQFRAFYFGFHSVCASNALIMLMPEEVELLVCGTKTLNLPELRKVTEYEGYKSDEDFIKEFWNVINSLTDVQKRKFLLFVTGSDRIPVGGMGDMNFKISKGPNKPDYLPEAHTCFNQLVLPQYTTSEKIKDKLLTAILNTEGFGLE